MTISHQSHSLIDQAGVNRSSENAGDTVYDARFRVYIVTPIMSFVYKSSANTHLLKQEYQQGIGTGHQRKHIRVAYKTSAFVSIFPTGKLYDVG